MKEIWLDGTQRVERKETIDSNESVNLLLQPAWINFVTRICMQRIQSTYVGERWADFLHECLERALDLR